MTLSVWSPRSGQVMSLRDEADFREKATDGVLVGISEGRPTLAWNSWVPVSLWCPVRGRARIAGRDLMLECGPDEVFVAEPGSRLTMQAAGAQDATLFGVMLPPERVQEAARRQFGYTLDDPAVFPAMIRNDAELNVPLLHLAHAVLRRGSEDALVARLVDELIVELVRRQTEYEPLIARCPGRSHRYRRQVFARLLRARNHIEFGTGADASLSRLADVARLSPTHFLRLYRRVFGQTPHKHVTRTRLVAARDLLLETSMGVSDICRTLGFENRCAFARVFKQHFGTSPSEMRLHAGTPGGATRTRGVQLNTSLVAGA